MVEFGAFDGQIRQDARIRWWERGVKPILAMPAFWEHLVLQPRLPELLQFPRILNVRMEPSGESEEEAGYPDSLLRASYPFISEGRLLGRFGPNWRLL